MVISTVCDKHMLFHVHADSSNHPQSMCQQLSVSLVMLIHSTKRLTQMPIQTPASHIQAHAYVPFKHQHLTCTQERKNIYSLSIAFSFYLCICLSLLPSVCLHSHIRMTRRHRMQQSTTHARMHAQTYSLSVSHTKYPFHAQDCTLTTPFSIAPSLALFLTSLCPPLSVFLFNSLCLLIVHYSFLLLYRLLCVLLAFSPRLAIIVRKDTCMLSIGL